jgi:drug/metabolite transporter (DMT)-like permease
MPDVVSRGRAAAAFAAIYVLWGGTYLAIALGLQSIPPFLLIGARSLLGGLALFAHSLCRGSTFRPWRDWLHAAISGALLFVGCHGALAYAQRAVPSGVAAIVLATIPFWMALINAALGQKAPAAKILGLAPGFVGVALIAWRQAFDPQHPLPFLSLALLLAASLSWGLGSIYAQRRAAYVPPEDLAGMQLICGGLGLVVLSAAAGEWSGFAPQKTTLVSLAGLLYLGLLGSALGNTAYLWLLDRFSAPVVATYTFVNPVIAVILGVAVLGERVTLLFLIGAALVLGSVAALLYQTYRERASEAAHAPGSRSIDRAALKPRNDATPASPPRDLRAPRRRI